AEPFDEVLMLASHLERVPAARREELGKWILERTWTSNDPRLYAAIGRLGARVPAYASAHHCVPARTAEEWLSEVITADFREIPGLAPVAAQLARKTGDRARDVSERARAATLAVLTRNDAPPALVEMVRDVVESSDAERREAFGEALPSGLRMIE
ncbi:MAG: heat-shock protein Hsp70, partial [Myxococcales bacterium]|nr:heat-shock protein Hsp70 [Myxococcales bacterium]